MGGALRGWLLRGRFKIGFETEGVNLKVFKAIISFLSKK
jgi:hypothetical protein